MSRATETFPIDIGGNRTVEYIICALTQINRNGATGTITLRAFGPRITKGVAIAQILSDKLPFSITSSEIGTITAHIPERTGYKDILVPFSTHRLRYDASNTSDVHRNYTIRQDRDRYIQYPAYCLLFDALLISTPRLQIKIPSSRGNLILTVASDPYSYVCRLESPPDHKRTTAEEEHERQFRSSITAAFYRCGMILSPVWEQVASQLSDHDDIILGLDTNTLSDAAVSEHVLSSLYFVTPHPYIYKPKWILLAIPSAVIHELEQGANLRNDRGLLRDKGRLSFRALQEILELDRNSDLAGISLMIVGETDPVLDTRAELRGLRYDLNRAPGSGGRKIGTSSGDMIIRTQYEGFLQRINFHKGIFFLTADKSNSALASVEGLHSIYYRHPSVEAVRGNIREPRFECEPDPPIRKPIPFGKLIYELAVQFGRLEIKSGAANVNVACDSKAEAMDHWLYRELQIDVNQVNELIRIYNTRPCKVPLAHAEQMCLETMHALLRAG